MIEYIKFSQSVNIRENITIYELLNAIKDTKAVKKIINERDVFIENAKINDYLNTFNKK